MLVRTSNASAGEFQDLVADGRPLYRHVADRLRQWAAPHVGESGYSLVGAVVGATYPGQLAELRAELPGILLPRPRLRVAGRDVARRGRRRSTRTASGALINNSRGITGAHGRPAYRERFGDRWQAAVEQAVRDMIEDLAANTPAGRLRASACWQESASSA